MDVFTYELAPALRGRGDQVAVYWSVAWRVDGPALPAGPLQVLDAAEAERVREHLAVQRIERTAVAVLAS